MTLWAVILLAVVQGLTEFLPVSSSGHLVVVNAVLEAFGHPPTQDLLEVEIVLHLGTLLAVLVFFWRETLHLLGRDRRLIPLLIVGTIPAAAIGIPLKQLATHTLENPLLAGFMFPVTAVLLVWASRRPEGAVSYREMGYGAALQIGLLQALALLPGVSRSGATIAGGLLANLDRRSAGTFAFLLAIPAIGGAGLIELVQLVRKHTSATADVESSLAVATAPAALAIGALVSMLVGIGSLWLLLRWVQRGKLAWFAWYLVPLGIAVVAWQLGLVG